MDIMQCYRTTDLPDEDFNGLPVIVTIAVDLIVLVLVLVLV